MLFATHYTTACVLLELGPFRLLTDPAFDPPGRTFSVAGLARYRRLDSAPPPDVGRLDACLVSHDQHEDNLDESGRALLRTAPVVLSTRAAAVRLGGAARGLAPFETTELVAPSGEVLRVTATPAQHAPKLLLPLAGPVIGFHLELEGAPRVWLSGDTVLFSGLHEVARRLPVDVAFVHLGHVGFAATGPAAYTMSAQQAVALAGLLPTATLVPLHYDGWSHFRQPRADAERVFTDAGLAPRVHWLRRGAREAVPPAPRLASAAP